MEGLVKSSSRKTKGRVTTTCIKSVFADANITTRGGTTTLPSGGRHPLTVTLGSRAKDLMKPAKFSVENLIKIQTAFNFSDKTTL